MLKYDMLGKSLTTMARPTLAEASILERGDLQKAILRSWDAFRNEMGMPELILLGEEILPHASCDDRIDLLALDESGRLVIIELKRGKKKLQLMQAIAYAGMVAQWNEDEFRKRVAMAGVSHPEDVERLLQSGRIDFRSPQVVLLAEMYEPEVIIGAHWLNDFGVPITAYAVNVLTHDGHTFLSMEQRYPLPELADTYVARGRSPERDAQTDAGWNDVLNEIKLPWARYAVSVLTRWKPGDPVTRRFGSLFSDGQFGPTQMNITHQHVKVYVRDPSEAQAERLRAALGPTIPLATWGSEQSLNSGHTFALKAQQDFDRFVAAASKPREPSADADRK